MSIDVKAHSPADFLAALPNLVGFDPRNSVVLVGFRDKVSCGALRLDLPTKSVTYKRAATLAVGTLSKVPRLDAVAVIICTDQPFGQSAEPPFADFAKVMMNRVTHVGFIVHSALCRAGDGWSSYRWRNRPVGGYPLSEIAESPMAALLPPVPVADIPPMSEAARRQVAADFAHYRRHGAFHPEFEDVPLFVELALEWTDDEFAESAALLLYLLQGPASRDAAMLQWATNLSMGDDLWATSQQPPGLDPQWDHSIGNLMLGIGPRPDHERMLQAIALLRRLVAVADVSAQPAPLCMLAWLSWALGLSSVAAVHLDAVRAIDPRYGMAEVLGTILGNGLLPEWAFAAT